MQISINISAATVVNDLLYFVPLNYNRLYSLNLNTKEQILLGEIVWEDRKIKRLYDKIIYVNGKLFLIPFYAKYLTIFDVENKQFQRVDIAGDTTMETSYIAAIAHNQYIFIFGHFASKIIRIDTISNEVFYISDWKEKVNSYIFSKKDGYFKSQVIKIGNTIYAPFCNANALLRLNGDTLESEVIVLGEEKNGYSGICCDSAGVFWLSPRRLNMYMIQWNEKKGEIVKFQIFNTEKDANGSSGLVANQSGLKVFTSAITDKEVNDIQGISYRYNTILLDDTGDTVYFNKMSQKMTVEKEGIKLLNDKIYVDFQESELKEAVLAEVVVESQEISIDIFLKLLNENSMSEYSKEGLNFIGRDIYNATREEK